MKTKLSGSQHLNLKWLEDFLVLANTLNFSRAAEQQNVSQSTFSRHIQSLEWWLGTRLIDRSCYPPALTPAGVEFRKLSEETVTQWHRFRNEIRLEVRGRGDVVRFTAAHTLSMSFFPELMLAVEKKIGPIKSSMTSGNLHDCVQSFIEEDTDFLISYYHPSIDTFLEIAGYPHVDLAKDVLLPVAGGANPAKLPGSTRKPVATLRYSPNSFLGKTVRHHLYSRSAVHMETVYENAFASALKAMAVKGYGIAWLPQSIVKNELARGELVPAGKEIWNVPLQIRAYRPRHDINEHTRRVWDAIVALKSS